MKNSVKPGRHVIEKKFYNAVILVSVLLLAACQRQATRSNWSPLSSATPQPSLSSTAASVAPSDVPAATATPRKTPTAVKIATLQISALAQKYPLATKGYELVTWQKDGDWVFTLLSGTNRQKSFDEILAEENTFTQTELIKVTVVGIDAFKELVGHLPKGEWITWGGMVLEGEVPSSTLYFTYPPDAVVDELIKYCKGKGITLVSLREK